MLEYIKVLETSGAAAGEPYTKHLDGDIYELRSISDRIFFAAAVGGRFVLLHQFHKKQQKTPKREIEQAKRELKDFRERSEKKMSVTLNGHTFTTWDDVEKDIFIPEEIAEAELKAAIVAEMVRARKENGITQQELEKRSGVRQPVIVRMEKGNTHT